ncbi:MAG TPA: RsmD family RNA methyltransferase, partial [Elusimicrobiota bacterium]|nr:RsmD family RNA methyltransferase [Elusimicrobiota bacterium]
PILGRIRKSLFDILSPRIRGSRFLDLYAGSGSVGLEALSRGAIHATFLDRNPHCLNIIRQNVSRLGFVDRARLVRGDANRNLSIVGGPFDLIFMGPPYHDDHWNALSLTAPTLRAIELAQILTEDGWVIGQHHAKEPAVEIPGWVLFRQERYGDSRLSFFTYGKPTS